MRTRKPPETSPAVPKFMRIAARHKGAIETLSDYEAGELFQQALRFVAGEPLKKFTCTRAELALAFLKPELAADIARQERISQARREAGRIGGETKAATRHKKIGAK